MKKITLLMITFLINNKNNTEETNLEIKKQEITHKIEELKNQIISKEKYQESEILKIKNEITCLDKELKAINLQIMHTEVELLDLVFNKELTAFKERNTLLENEIQSLKKDQNCLSNEIKDKQDKLEILNNKKISISSNLNNNN